MDPRLRGGDVLRFSLGRGSVLRHEPQGHPVVAPALARGLGAVVEQVPVVPAAAHAVVLGARIDDLEVGLAAIRQAIEVLP